MVFGSGFEVLLLAAVGANPQNPVSRVTPIDLRCEYQVEPLGIDSLHPRFSWIIKESTKEFDQNQIGYRILVSSNSELLRKSRGDLWDSGMVSSTAQNNIPYGGTSLKPGHIYFWKVAVWSKPGTPTWSKLAKFEAGLLHPANWTAKCINDGKSNPKTDS